jgi:hypothetical protein
MPASQFLNSILSGTAPQKIRMVVSQGLAPLPPSELVQAIVHLAGDPDPDIASRAQNSLRNWPEEELISHIQARTCTPEVMAYLAANSSSQDVQEAIILNPAAPAEVIARMALVVPGRALESVMYNRVRLLQNPAILASVRQNPAITPEIKRLIQEIETEFFGEKKKSYNVEETSEPGEPAQESAQPALQLEETTEDLTLEGLPIDPEEREMALMDRIGKMTVPQKLRYAMLGNREARSILIRDPNRMVSLSVLQSPKLTDSEVEAMAAMRNVSDDILREIGNNRGLTRNYGVVQALVKNPKTPLAISQRLMCRLMNRDLVHLTRDRSVSEGVRRTAQRTVSQRTEKKS